MYPQIDQDFRDLVNPNILLLTKQSNEEKGSLLFPKSTFFISYINVTICLTEEENKKKKGGKCR